MKTVLLDDFAFAADAAFQAPRQIVELKRVIGLYMMFARLAEVAELEIDVITGGDFWMRANDYADQAGE